MCLNNVLRSRQDWLHQKLNCTILNGFNRYCCSSKSVNAKLVWFKSVFILLCIVQDSSDWVDPNSTNHFCINSSICIWVQPKIINRSRLFIQCYNFRSLLYQLCSPDMCKFKIGNVKFTFTWRTLLIHNPFQITSLGVRSTWIGSIWHNAPFHG